MLEYKILYGDILIFKNKNDCMTISKGNDGYIDIDSIEIDGERIDHKDCKYNLLSHPKNTFTQDEYEYFRDIYIEIIN